MDKDSVIAPTVVTRALLLICLIDAMEEHDMATRDIYIVHSYRQISRVKIYTSNLKEKWYISLPRLIQSYIANIL